MTKEMRLIFEKGKWNDKRDTPAAAPPPCRLHFLMFSALHAEKAALLRRKNAFGRTAAFLAPRMPSQNKKAIPYGMTFCFGGDKRDRTADLMTASCYRFVMLSVLPSIPSVPSAKSAGFCKVLSIASTRFRAHLGHNLGQTDVPHLTRVHNGSDMHQKETGCKGTHFTHCHTDMGIQNYIFLKIIAGLLHVADILYALTNN